MKYLKQKFSIIMVSILMATLVFSTFSFSLVFALSNSDEQSCLCITVTVQRPESNAITVTTEKEFPNDIVICDTLTAYDFPIISDISSTEQNKLLNTSIDEEKSVVVVKNPKNDQIILRYPYTTTWNDTTAFHELIIYGDGSINNPDYMEN